MIRAFIGVDIDPQTIEKISDAIAQLKPHIGAVRWVPPTNFHLTVKFLGDIEEAKVAQIIQALERELRPFPRFTINAKGLGVFPGVKRPRVLWVGLEGNGLAALAAKVQTALMPLGFMPENRAFQPHLTVARWRGWVSATKILGEELEKWKNHEFGQSKTDEVILFQSVLKPEGALYRSLAVVRLAHGDS